MVFTVECPECNSEFPVDSAKVPDDGVYAKCSICPGTFLVQTPAESAEDSDQAFGPPEGATLDAAEGATEAEIEGSAEIPDQDFGVAADMADAEVAGAVEVAQDEELEVAQEPATAATAIADAPTFGQTDPDARAARLARVLISDMMTYNPAMYDKAMSAGTLVEDFAEEVKRSWSEYVEQVGEDLAKSTPHFTEALNNILAKGEELFDEGMYE